MFLETTGREKKSMLKSFKEKRAKKKELKQAAERSVMKRQLHSVGFVQGIKKMKFAYGKAENDALLKENLVLENEDKQFYRQVDKPFGRDQPIYLWVMNTVEPGQLITDIELCHVNPMHDDHKALEVYTFSHHLTLSLFSPLTPFYYFILFSLTSLLSYFSPLSYLLSLLSPLSYLLSLISSLLSPLSYPLSLLSSYTTLVLSCPLSPLSLSLVCRRTGTEKCLTL